MKRANSRTDGLMDGTGMSDTEQRVPRRIRRIQTISLVMLVVCGTINYLDRGALSVANPAIRADLGVSLSGMGLLLSAFAWSYALVQLPVGGLVDNLAVPKDAAAVAHTVTATCGNTDVKFPLRAGSTNSATATLTDPA